MLPFILLVVAFVCFVLAAFQIATARVSLVGVGLACWVLVPLIDAWPSR